MRLPCAVEAFCTCNIGTPIVWSSTCGLLVFLSTLGHTFDDTLLIPRQGDFDVGPLSPLPPGEGAKAMTTENLTCIVTQY